METKYPAYQNNESIQAGLEFQDFVTDVLRERKGLIVQVYQSKRYQFEIGESPQGIEIKLDRRCTETGQLSIEIGEKSNAANARFVPSGIYRNDNTWLYVQGNYEIIYGFGLNILRLLHSSKRYREHPKPTVQTYYLPLDDACKYALFVIDDLKRV